MVSTSEAQQTFEVEHASGAIRKLAEDEDPEDDKDNEILAGADNGDMKRGEDEDLGGNEDETEGMNKEPTPQEV